MALNAWENFLWRINAVHDERKFDLWAFSIEFESKSNAAKRVTAKLQKLVSNNFSSNLFLEILVIGQFY